MSHSDLNYYSWRDHPSDGWLVEGRRMHPPNAYVDEIDFIKQFIKFFPKKGEGILDKIGGNALSVKRATDRIVFDIIGYMNRSFKE